MKRKLSNLAIGLVFLLGVGVLLYPTVSDHLNAKNQTRVIETYNEEAARLEQEKWDALWRQAREYNEALYEKGGYFPLTDAEKEAYMATLNLAGDGVMGYIEIPRIDVRLPIAHTTDEDVLQKYIGHLEPSSLPVGGENTHAALSGHRGLPTAKLFTDLDQMQVGDRFTLYILNDRLVYEVDQILTVLPEETQALGVEPGKDYVTLVTCTPYAVNTHRLLVRGARVTDAEPEAEAEPEAWYERREVQAAIAAGITAVIALGVWIAIRRRRRRERA